MHVVKKFQYFNNDFKKRKKIIMKFKAEFANKKIKRHTSKSQKHDLLINYCNKHFTYEPTVFFT